MLTSSFYRSAYNPFSVSISLMSPPFFNGRKYKELAPTWEMLSLYKKFQNKLIYTHEYDKILSDLDPKKVFTDLGEHAILCCWCLKGKFCHRHLVAKWLEENLNITIKEL